nr:DUF2785 domain-containing protein [Paenibacillus sp. Marseille-Q4541]
MNDLKRIEREKYQLREGENLQDFINLMLEYIGDPDPELRDELIYPTFYTWISEQGRFTDSELRNLLEILTDEEHLFYQIGNVGDQSVFTRTFSVLPIALIIRCHWQQPFLNHEQFQHLKTALIRYYIEEKDLRGLLLEGGWAHSAAHGADALEELVQCPESDLVVQLEVLDAVRTMLWNGVHIFSEEEDERIASILDTQIIQNLVPSEKMTDWIGKLSTCIEGPRNRRQDIARVNSKNVLRSLYFRRIQAQGNNGVTDALLTAENKLNNFAIDKY